MKVQSTKFSNMDIATYISDNVNVVEIYLCPSIHDITKEEKQDIDVGWKGKIPALFRWKEKGTEMDLKLYYHRDITYSYELATDAQRIWRKSMVSVQFDGSYCIIGFDEEILPSHRYPAVREVTHEEHIRRVCYRINNRMFLYHDTVGEDQYLYIRYQHAQNVDLKKINGDLHQVLSQLGRKDPNAMRRKA